MKTLQIVENAIAEYSNLKTVEERSNEYRQGFIHALRTVLDYCENDYDKIRIQETIDLLDKDFT